MRIIEANELLQAQRLTIKEMDIYKVAEKSGKRAKRVPGYIRYTIIILAFALTGYWIYTDSGVYIWMAELQASLSGDGMHSMTLSVFGTLFSTLFPAGIIIHLLAGLFKKEQKSE